MLASERAFAVALIFVESLVCEIDGVNSSLWACRDGKTKGEIAISGYRDVVDRLGIVGHSEI